jgi:hypothetical protein
LDAEEIKKLYLKLPDFKNEPCRPGEMSHKERFSAIMDFKAFDRIVDTEFGYWDNTLKRWHNEGLPPDINTIEKADMYFGFDRWYRHLPVAAGLFPDFKEEIIEKNDRYIVKYDHRRIKCRVFRDGKDTIPHFLDFPIKDRKTYEELKQRFKPQVEKRLPLNLTGIAEAVKERNYILSMYIGSTAGWLRDFMGFENFATSILMQPELIKEILEDFKILFTSIAEKVTEYLIVDFVHWWEDIAYKNGPILSPGHFMELCGPVYKETMDIFRSSGTRFADVDCDGDMSLLVPTWINSGINIMFPLEVASGIHPESLRRKYPGIRMMGGFDKKILSQGKETIKKELKRLKPLVSEGGYIPHVDHRVQADISLKDYLYYLEAKRDIYEIPNKVNRSI